MGTVSRQVLDFLFEPCDSAWGKCLFTRADEDKRGGPTVPKIDLQTAVSSHCYSNSVSASFELVVLQTSSCPSCVVRDAAFLVLPAPAPRVPLGLSEKPVRSLDWGTPLSFSFLVLLLLRVSPFRLAVISMELGWEREVRVCLVQLFEPETHTDPSFLSFYHMCFCCKFLTYLLCSEVR